MNQLPNRPRSHQLDYEGRLALQTVMPTHFLVRHADQPEYGIDGEVEVFDEDNEDTTGLRFYFQLKSTDDDDERTALKVSLNSSTANYLRSTTLPVLVVLYRSVDRNLYARWIHHYDPYYESRSRGRLQTDTITFHLAGKDELTDQRARRLAAEARAYLNLRERILPQPFPLYVSSDHPNVTTTQLVVAIRQALKGVTNLIDLSASPTPAGESVLELRPDALEVRIFDTTSLTVHDDLEIHGVEQLANDAAFAVAMALLHANIDAPSVRLALYVAARSRLILHPDFVLFLVSALKATNRYSEALHLAADLVDTGGDYAALAQIVLFAVLGNEEALNEEERGRLTRTYKALIAISAEAGDTATGASLSYSLGKLKMSVGDLVEAYSHLNKARRLDGSYADRQYYWSDMGGCLFLLQRFKASASAYHLAVTLDPENALVRCLLADGLFFSGHIHDARMMWSQALAENPQVQGHYEWRLKYNFASMLIQEMAAPRTVPPISFEPHSGVTESDVREDLPEYLSSLIQFSPLHPHAWFNLGVAYNQAGQVAEAFECFKSAALLNRGDAEAWVNAILLAASDVSNAHGVRSDPEWLGDLMSTAYVALGEELFVELQARLADQGVPLEWQEGLLSLVEGMVSPLRHEGGSNVVRFPQEDNRHIAIEIEKLIG